LGSYVTSMQSARNRAKVRAPEFPAGTWFNTGEPLSLKQLRGRIVLLDFWTFACGNCLHVIDELRQLEHSFADELVIIGVHSPKFEHERGDDSVRAASERYGVEHPVVNDPQLYLWQQYAIRAWPTLVLIDPNGYVVAQAAGEGQLTALAAMISELIAEHEAAGSLRRGDNPYVAPSAEPGDLRFPAKAVQLGDSLFIADAGHHQIVETALDGVTVRRRIGSGTRGRSADSFVEPNGLAVLGIDVADELGFDLVVADTGNHVLRGVRSTDGAIVRTVDLPAALTATGIETITGPVPAVLSPWDVAWWPAAGTSGLVAIAAAGVHLLLGWDPRADSVRILAGTTVEGLKDGPALDGWLAQPSGLAVDGDRLWFADSETSALRYLTVTGELHTVIGEGLFDFGHIDGAAGEARLQHPLGVAVLPDHSIAIADTYNGAIRRYEANATGSDGTVSTLATDLAEPSGLLVVDGEIVIVESAAHRLVRPVTAAQLRQVIGEPLSTQRPVTELQPGHIELSVPFMLAPGQTTGTARPPG
jgi:thiol-disulfide isomerase/thioredoxin